MYGTIFPYVQKYFPYIRNCLFFRIYGIIYNSEFTEFFFRMYGIILQYILNCLFFSTLLAAWKEGFPSPKMVCISGE
jgi:hypothetical protein